VNSGKGGEREYFLTTSRIGFSRWTSADLPLAHSLWGDPEVSRLIGGPFSREQVEERLARELENMTRHGFQYWPMFLLEGDEFLGCAGLKPYKTERRVFEMGFQLRRAYWGRGLATEAARAVVDYAFRSLDADGLFAGHHPQNAASQKVLEKLGFRFTGDELYLPTGLRHRSYLLANPRREQPAL